jgi:signal transduction histidine kinase
MLAGVPAMPPGTQIYDQQHVRMFVASHFYGPFIGLAMAGFLLFLGFPLDYRIYGFVGLVCLFWIYPFALSGGASYRALCLCSLQHLALVIVWGSHGYGGLASPILLWLAVVPLLAFLYLSPTLRIWLVLAAIIALNAAGLVAVSLIAPPPAAAPGALQWLALASVLCASIYVSLMATHFGRVLNSRVEIEQEAARQERTAAILARHTVDLRRTSADKAAIIAKVGDAAAAPLSHIIVACQSLEREAESEPGQDASDRQSIVDAARYLSEVVRDVAQYARLETEEQVVASSTFDLNILLKNIARHPDEQSGTTTASAIIVEETQPVLTISSDPALLEASVIQLIRHLGNSHAALPLTLRGSRLPGEVDDHITIDVFRDYGADPSLAQTVCERRAIGDRPTKLHGGSLSLTLANRLAAVLGGSISPHPARPNGSHFRIELPAEPVVQA